MTARRTTFAAAGAVLLTLTACGGGGEEAAEEPAASVEEAPEFEAGTTMAEIAEAGTMTIGTKFDQPGFGLQGLEGAPEGFDVQIATYVAGQLGIAPEDISWVEAPSAQREDLIVNGTVDLVVATYTINDTRRERITFAGPYYVAGQQIMVGADEERISGPEDLRANPDVTVCSVTGSTPAENIRQYLAAPEQLVEFEVYDDCVTAMENGQVQAVTTDNVILTGYVAESDGAFKLVGEQFTEEPYGIGIAKGDVAFCEFINDSLAQAAEEGYYEEAWTSTAGQFEGTEVPELPEPDECV
ncbi:glutamate ABC transporter substrate-binding protein [Quadrisphaera sp. DSM 44207]|uniref:glutamate ABC transporter substrate-binding protein n=1 Tax=Quadrisphaera sp. DSM 44207 TaxID=1881057 RepID=UPI00087F3A3E|nr:glutamate ABC transporter substrate-binding protein [Quadrisphaera sp. DSM 44207]SDQ33873.1 amino acid ABC transporter substrate-binding protein, PAAT family [Quadrisphaera sp. DSM 44207]